MTSNTAERDCLCFFRDITNLKKNFHLPRAIKFIDTLDSGSRLDEEAQRLLKVLKDEKIPSVLTDKINSAYFQIEWKDRSSKNPTDNPEYLEKFGESFKAKMEWLIGRSVNQSKSATCNSQLVEIIQHLTMTLTRSVECRGRETTLDKVYSYLKSDASRPLVLYGESGSGKTSVIATVKYYDTYTYIIYHACLLLSAFI